MDLITSAASPPHDSQQFENPNCFADADPLSNEKTDFVIDEENKSSVNNGSFNSNNRPCKEFKRPLQLETTSVFKDFISDVRKKLIEKIKTVTEADNATEGVKSGRHQSRARRQVARKSTNLVQSSILLCFSSKYAAVKHKLNEEKNISDNFNVINALDEIQERVDKDVISNNKSERPFKISRIETKVKDIYIQSLDDVSRSSAPEIGRTQNDSDAPTKSLLFRSKSLLDVSASSSALITEADKPGGATVDNLENLTEMGDVNEDDEQILIKIVETAERVAEKFDDKLIHESEKLPINSCINHGQDNSIKSNGTPLENEKTIEENHINPVITKKELIESDENADFELLSENNFPTKISAHKKAYVNTSTEEVPIPDFQKVDSTLPSNLNLSLSDTHQESASQSPIDDPMVMDADSEAEDEAESRLIAETLKNNSIKVITTDTDYQGSISTITELSFDDRKKNETKKNVGSVGEKESMNDSRGELSISKDPVSVASFDDDDLVLIFHSGVSSSKDKSACHLDPPDDALLETSSS